MSPQLDFNSSRPRDLLFVTGTRADYGKLEPLALEAADAGHAVTFFVTGMHMMERYGLTKVEVARNGQFKIIEFINQREGDPQDVVLAKTVLGFSDLLQEHHPDLVVIHGDRVEALACSLVCAMNEIRSAHVEGGEVSGTIDEQFRHCNTKLASAHLVSSDVARARVQRMGEAADSIFVIGSPEIDVHSKPSGLTLEKVRDRYQIPFAEYGICIFHPVTSESESMGEQAEALFQCLRDSNRCFVVILPNNDPGSNAIFKIIEDLPKDFFRILPSMRFSYFSELLRHAAAIIGNSSAGVREAPFLGVPSLDVGTRQANRTLTESVWHCDAYDRNTINRFLNEAWGFRYARCNGFGTGDAARNFAELLATPSFWASSLQKYFVE